MQRNTCNMVQLYRHQEEALTKLKSGSILCGGVGSGKTLTALEFYRRNYDTKNLIVITTAKKRNSADWESEATLIFVGSFVKSHIIVDSWNNIEKYAGRDAFFIFDEQRVVGYGKWSKSFIKIARSGCPWILLSATPGDTWMDYIPVFIANGFYKNKTDFINQHVEFDRFAKFPKVKAFHNTGKLAHYRKSILVDMPVHRHTKRHDRYFYTTYDTELYLRCLKERWNVFEDKPVETPSELVQCLRRLVSASEGRIAQLRFMLNVIDRAIIFYNYDYELEILRETCSESGIPFSEYNGHKHEEIPDTERWVYLVQYTAGAEGWNCTSTDTIIFYSPNYSYKVTEQSKGRIDRLNTKYVHLNYLWLVSKSEIDHAVLGAIKQKKKFNESAWGEASGKRKRISRKTETRNTDPFAGKYSS